MFLSCACQFAHRLGWTPYPILRWKAKLWCNSRGLTHPPYLPSHAHPFWKHQRGRRPLSLKNQVGLARKYQPGYDTPAPQQPKVWHNRGTGVESWCASFSLARTGIKSTIFISITKANLRHLIFFDNYLFCHEQWFLTGFPLNVFQSFSLKRVKFGEF